MMVTRPKTLYKTPTSSRGNSPARTTAQKKTPAQSPVKKVGRSPARTPAKSPARTPAKSPARSPLKTPPNSNQKKNLWNGQGRRLERTPSEPRNLGSRGSSPARTPQSRGSEGSLDIYDETDNRRIISSFKDGEDNINVVVRVRPLNNKEVRSGNETVVTFPGNGQIMVDDLPTKNQKTKIFSYNVVFEPAATQEDVLQFSGIKRLIEMSLEGFRCTAFCYGQTGSGKTHTLTGPPGLFGKKFAPYSDQHGLVFRSFLYLFQLIKEKPAMHFVLKASFLEIYNEKVIDLLNPGSARKPLAVRWSKKARGFFVENLFTVDCEELDDLIAVLEEGMRNRSVGSHHMNENSSRSHTILTVHITSEQPAENGVFISRYGKINFVDLAGSEMTKKTQSEGKTLEEANNINKSLMVLGYCIASLSDARRKTNHIPYRDSQLTKLLADSLAGNGVTLMIACISPARYNLAETVNTLRYAARAKKIRTKPVVLMDPREALILSLKREVNVLQTENEHLRSALNGIAPKARELSSADPEKSVALSIPDVDINHLGDLDGPQLTELVKLCMAENEALRKENAELFTSRDALLHDHEIVTRENERLLKKLEDVNTPNFYSSHEYSACVRSPLITARPAISSDLSKYSSDADSSRNANIWTNPVHDNHNHVEMPVSIQKELDKRMIGNGVSTHIRHNSWDGRPSSNNAIRMKSSGSDGGKVAEIMQEAHTKPPVVADWSPQRPAFSMGNKEVFGSTISLDQDDDDIFERA